MKLLKYFKPNNLLLGAHHPHFVAHLLIIFIGKMVFGSFAHHSGEPKFVISMIVFVFFSGVWGVRTDTDRTEIVWKTRNRISRAMITS